MFVPQRRLDFLSSWYSSGLCAGESDDKTADDGGGVEEEEVAAAVMVVDQEEDGKEMRNEHVGGISG